MPKSRIAKDSSELAGQNQLDQVDRSDWPEIAELEAPEAAIEGVAKSANRTNPNKQSGTTGAKPMPYPSIEELRESQRKGNEGRGLPENSVDQLNEAQGHKVDIKEWQIMPEDTANPTTYLPKESIYEAILRVRGVSVAVTQSGVTVVLPIDGKDKIITIDRSTGETR